MKALILIVLIAHNLAFATCKEQKFIDELDTRHYYDYWLKQKNPEKVQAYLDNLHKFRASNFGHAVGEPDTYSYNKNPVTKFLVHTTFMGLNVRMHKKVVSQLKCVEQEILKSCQGDGNAYIPRRVSGYRPDKSYKRVISNHQFGIAIDFDPLEDHSHNDGNPCCGPSCKISWNSHPICKNHDTAHNSPYNVAKINPCWVKSFEKYGFHWLINFRMHDTMHFEYLADPNEL